MPVGEPEGKQEILLFMLNGKNKVRHQGRPRQGEAEHQDRKTNPSFLSAPDPLEGVERDLSDVYDAPRDSRATLGKSIGTGPVIGHLSHPSVFWAGVGIVPENMALPFLTSKDSIILVIEEQRP